MRGGKFPGPGKAVSYARWSFREPARRGPSPRIPGGCRPWKMSFFRPARAGCSCVSEEHPVWSEKPRGSGREIVPRGFLGRGGSRAQPEIRPGVTGDHVRVRRPHLVDATRQGVAGHAGRQGGFVRPAARPGPRGAGESARPSTRWRAPDAVVGGTGGSGGDSDGRLRRGRQPAPGHSCAQGRSAPCTGGKGDAARSGVT